jgi:6-phosphogluconolactonase
VYDVATGGLTPSSVSDGGTNPSFMAFSPNHKTVYAVNEASGGGRMLAFQVNPENGALSKISNVSSGGGGPCHVSVHKSGKWVYAAHYGSGHVSVMTVDENGGIGEPSQVEMAGKNAHMAITDGEAKFLYVPTLGLDQVQIFNIDQSTGKLTRHDPPFVTLPPKGGPRHMAFAPNNKQVYVINELGWLLTSFNYDAASGNFSNPNSIPTMEGYTGKGSCAHVMVSADGRFVYGSNRGFDNIIICSVDQNNGTLTAIGHESGDGEIKTPRNFNIDSSGKHMIVASQGSNYVTVFDLDPATGLLKRKNKVSCGNKPTFVGFLPRQ